MLFVLFDYTELSPGDWSDLERQVVAWGEGISHMYRPRQHLLFWFGAIKLIYDFLSTAIAFISSPSQIWYTIYSMASSNSIRLESTSRNEFKGHSGTSGGCNWWIRELDCVNEWMVMHTHQRHYEWINCGTMDHWRKLTMSRKTIPWESA